MSGICGIINFDNRPIERSQLENMANSAAHRGVDGIRYYLRAHIGFVHLALHTTPESKTEMQPIVNEELGLTLVADARIDDRQSLIRKIRAKSTHLPEKPGDAVLIMAAYRVWGDDCTKYLLGDFAFVLWDSNNRQVFAARDRGGCRSFYYRHTQNSIIFATEASQILADSSYQQILNRQMVARDLIMPGYGGRHQSYYIGIEKLGSGEQLNVTANKLKRTEYWQLQPGTKITYKDPREYSEHFRELFSQCVRDRLRCEGEIGLFLSGGLDSSSIAAVAGSEITNNSSTVTQNLRCVNWTYGENHVANEKHFGQAVASKWNLNFEEHSMVDHAPFYDYPWRQLHADEPYNTPISSFFVATLDKYSRTKSAPKVWMTGFYGDALVGGQNPFYYTNLIKKGRVIKVIQELSAHKQAYKLNWQQAFSIAYFSPLVIRPLKQRLHHLRKGKRVYARNWILQELLEETKTYEWVMDLPVPEWINTRGGHEKIDDSALDFRYRMLDCNVAERLRVWFERTFAQFGAESWSPWDDSRIPEFILSIPQDQIAEGLNHKLIVRNSLKDLLPQALVDRRELRTGPGIYLEQGFRNNSKQAIERITRNMKAEELKIIDGRIFKDRLQHFFDGKSSYDKITWLGLLLEIWLQQRKF